MRLSHVEICGFRGYRERVRIDFGSLFTVIDGRNGVGKSTVFDAIEFGLTGALSKYDGHHADGETVADYLWWTGDETPPNERFVQIGFVGEDGSETLLRRSPLGLDDEASFKSLRRHLLVGSDDRDQALKQLCAATIIRDEFITALSLDQTEGNRYGFLRDALGASDAEKWIGRASNLVVAAKSKRKEVESEVARANEDLARAVRRLDEVRVSVSSDESLASGVAGLRRLLGSDIAVEELASAARSRLADLSGELNALTDLISEAAILYDLRLQLAPLTEKLESLELRELNARRDLELLSQETKAKPSLLSDAARLSRDVMTLAALGRQIQLHDGRCPLCSKEQSQDSFDVGLARAEERARELDRAAAEVAKFRQRLDDAKAKLDSVVLEVAELRIRLAKLRTRITEIESKAKRLGVAVDAPTSVLVERRDSQKRTIEAAEKDLRVVETLRLNEGLQRAVREEEEARQRVQKAQVVLGRTRRLHTNATTIHDAARRAASETLDLRLDRVLPLMAELYQRLRPHPVWGDIEYSIRGDVKRFLTLRVGESLNPQFLFSSGQRRATGLAFLLSVNLSLAWSRWRTILLDDPVQHIDDFRSVHLAELLSQVAREGRQIICAVEDSALASLLSRRLQVERPGSGRRVTLGTNSSGALSVRSVHDVESLPFARLVVGSERTARAAG